MQQERHGVAVGTLGNETKEETGASVKPNRHSFAAKTRRDIYVDQYFWQKKGLQTTPQSFISNVFLDGILVDKKEADH